MSTMNENLAAFKMQAVHIWKGYTNIMSKYLLQSAVPILFHRILNDKYIFIHNEEFNAYKLCDEKESESYKEELKQQLRDEYGKKIEEAKNDDEAAMLKKKLEEEENNINRTYYNFRILDKLKKGWSPGREDRAHKAVWTRIWMNQLAEFTKLRLLGEQTEDMKSYHRNSYNYIRLMGALLCHQELPASQATIRKLFMEMLRDYLLRNMPGLPAGADGLPLNKLLETCEKKYNGCKSYKDKGIDNYYVDFSSVLYGKALMDQIKGMASSEGSSEETYANMNYFVANVEYLYTFIIYAYMVEFVLYKTESTENNMLFRMYKVRYNTFLNEYIEKQNSK